MIGNPNKKQEKIRPRPSFCEKTRILSKNLGCQKKNSFAIMPFDFLKPNPKFFTTSKSSVLCPHCFCRTTHRSCLLLFLSALIHHEQNLGVGLMCVPSEFHVAFLEKLGSHHIPVVCLVVFFSEVGGHVRTSTI